MVRAMQRLYEKAAHQPEASHNRLGKVGQFLCLLQPLLPESLFLTTVLVLSSSMSALHIDIYIYCSASGMPQKTGESSSYIYIIKVLLFPLGSESAEYHSRGKNPSFPLYPRNVGYQ